MSNQPAVSVVMPIYNAEPYLREALDSVVNQTLKNIEIVCVNDGSKDTSLQTMKEYAEKDERIVILDNPNGGYGHAMNEGIKAATGEYIGILEPDDCIKADMFETLYNRAKHDDLDFVRSNYCRMTTTGPEGLRHLQEKKISPKPEYYDVTLNPQENLDLFNIRMENWTGIYKTTFIRGNQIRFNESPGAGFQDNGFWFQTYCYATKIAIIDKSFYCYRVDNAASSINQPNKVFVMLDEYKWIESWLESHPDLYKRFIGIFEYKKTHNCMFAFSRLADDYQLDFLKRYSSEYAEAFDKGLIDEKLFWPDELSELKAIVADPSKYLEERRKRDAFEKGLAEARERGGASLFAFYARNEGIGSAMRRTFKHLAH